MPNNLNKDKFKNHIYYLIQSKKRGKMKITLISTSTFPNDQGLRTLSACLEREGHEVLMIFLPLVEDYTRKYTEKELKQVEEKTKGSQLIGIGSMESTTGRAKQLIDLFQKKGIPVVWGGPHATFFPEKCFKIGDIIAVGEAEEAIVEIANKIERGEPINNILNFWIRINGKEYKNPVRSPPNNLDVLAPPDFDIEDQWILERGKLIPFEERHLAGMLFFQTERGCPQACSYCTNNILRALYAGKADLLRTHSVDYVINFFKTIKKKFPSIKVIDIRDETITVRKLEWLREFSEKYKKEIGLRMKCLAEPATMAFGEVSDEKIRLLVNIPKPYFLSVNNLIFFEGTPLYKKALDDGYIKTYNDTAGNLNYWDRWKHIKLKKKNPYLNLVLNMMRGSCTNRRYGLLPAWFVDYLTSPRVVKYNVDNEKPTYAAGELVEVMDDTREKIIKPIYRAMPISVKVFYDRVRYRM